MVHGRMMHEIYRVIKISCAFCITPRAVRQETLVHICMRVSPRLILILAAVLQICLLFLTELDLI
jgi:hypothetical protein